MRVVHLRKFFLPLFETFIYDRLQALVECGIDTHVVTPERKNEELYPFDNVHEV